MAENKYLKYAFLSAFTNIPIAHKGDKFLEEIKNIFSQYKEGLQRFTKKGNGKPDNVIDPDIIYQPVPYCLFGDFDLAVFSLIDDFSFASKKFKPNLEGINFKYQVNTGIVPLVDIYDPANSKLEKFEKQELVNFLKGDKFYPFTGITSLKLNNSMLVGVGQDFIDMMNLYLVATIDSFIKEKETLDDRLSMFYIITDNLGWNELTVYFFSNSIEAINEISQCVKSNRLRDIRSIIESLCKETDKNNDEAKKKLACIDNTVLLDSLLSQLIKENGDPEVDYLESHPIVAGSTLFGYHIDHILPDKGKSIMEKIGSDKVLELYQEQLMIQAVAMTWNVKPGHEVNANEELRAAMPKELLAKLDKTFGPEKNKKVEPSALYKQNQAGKFSYTFPNELISFKDYFELLAVSDQRFQGKMLHNIIKYKSRISLQSAVIPRSYDNKLHYEYNLDTYKIDGPTCVQIVSRLRTYPISHTIKSQIENLILNFNDAVTDPLMYNYFIGLRSPLLKFLENELLLKTENSPSEVQSGSIVDQEDINFDDFFELIVPEKETRFDKKSLAISSSMKAFTSFVETWNKAYWNRHFHGYYFTEINDFNIEHHGGIQQILFCYDAIYKIISKRIYGDASTDPFVNVRIDPIITSSKYFNTINFMHLFKPSVYACECVHEAANEVIPFIVRTLQKSEYGFLSNPQNIYDRNFEKFTTSFEEGLKKTIGSRDAFEVQFINEYVGINSIRYIFTDYISCALAYKVSQVPGKIDFDGLELFYHTRWFLFLTRADLYMTDSQEGSWYFNESDFKFLFIRSNLMFVLMYGLTSDDLHKLNEECPSVELSAFWESLRGSLISFVIRLARALEDEFQKQKVSVKGLREIIQAEIIERTIEDDCERQIYDQIIELNHKLITAFYDDFKSGESENYYNTIVRNAVNEDKSNIEFYPDHDREVFLDPKGNIFSISQKQRLRILQSNIIYLKSIWNVAMKASRMFYPEQKKEGA